MSQRKIFVGLLVAVALIVPAVFRRTPSNAQAIVERDDPKNRRELIGTTSCSASVCHGGAALGEPLGEALTWRSLDPHARAYDSLLTPRSQAMARHLWGEKTKAHDAPLCLKCHVHPDYDNARPNFRKQDGVGCESCHGAAQDWLKPHYRAGWNQANKVSLGFADTKSLSGRAEICSKCHVGTPDASVDHDLIAAGHPALRFEFTTYLANLPPHWDVPKDKRANSRDSAKPVDFELRAWAIGQHVASATAWELLAFRAAPNLGRAWPELAEMDCFACHHDLQDARWRRSTKGQLRPGSLVKNDWYDVAPLDARLSAILFTPTSRAEVAAEAVRQANLAQSAAGKFVHRNRMDTLSFESIRKKHPDENWNNATHHYFFLLAQRAMREDNQLPVDDPLRKRIAQYREAVVLPSGFDSPFRRFP